MIKKLLLTFAMITLLTIAFSGTTYTTQAEEKAAITEELASTLSILNNLYKEGVITEEEFSTAKSMLLDPTLSSGKKAKKKTTAAERKRLKEAKAAKLEAQKQLLIEEQRAEKERIKQEKGCAKDPANEDECKETLVRSLEKLKALSLDLWEN